MREMRKGKEFLVLFEQRFGSLTINLTERKINEKHKKKDSESLILNSLSRNQRKKSIGGMWKK